MTAPVTAKVLQAAAVLAEVDAKTPEGEMTASDFVLTYLSEHGLQPSSPSDLLKDIQHGRAMIRTMRHLGAIG